MRNQDVLFVSESSKISRVRQNLGPQIGINKEKEKIVKLAKASSAILFKASTFFPFTFFPFTFFPDTIIIDKTKITIIERLFFFNADIRSYAIEDILNVDIGIGILFSTLKCETRYDNKKVFVLRYLKKKDATFARKLIQGLIIAKREGVHLEELSEEEILSHGEEIGKGADQHQL